MKMKQYKEVNIVICQLEQQDVLTESGGIDFLKWLNPARILGWDPSINDSWFNEEGWE